MKTNNLFFVVLASLLTACGVSIPQAENTSYETITITKSDITLPLKYSATLKGTFFKKNTQEIFAYIKKKQYLCTRF